MKRTNKKGFTIVELVIVIAVVAILAAVLIPTFASLVSKADNSADTQMVANINKYLAALGATDGKNENIVDAMKDAEEAGYSAKALANATNDILWDSKNDCFVAVKPDSKKIVAGSDDSKIGDKADYWIISNEVSEDYAEYALCLTSVVVKGDIEVAHGLYLMATSATEVSVTVTGEGIHIYGVIPTLKAGDKNPTVHGYVYKLEGNVTSDGAIFHDKADAITGEYSVNCYDANGDKVCDFCSKNDRYVCNHTDAAKTVITEATCTQTGVDKIVCNACGYIDFVASEKLPHTEAIDEAVAATCTGTGLTEGKHCSVCNTILVKQEKVAALGHDMQKEIAEVPATCEKSGVSAHKECTRCGHVEGKETIEALGHSFTNYVSNKDATCAQDGTKTAKCDRCDATDTVTDVGSKDTVKHTVVTVTGQAATCENAGWTDGEECSVCGKTIKGKEIIQATGHQYDDGVVTKAPTCEDKGVKTYTCTSCGATKTEDIDATGHAMDGGKVTKEAKCEDAGEKTYTCTTCGHTTTEEIAAPGHDWNDGTITTIATCQKEGVKTYTCKSCKATKTEKLGYDSDNHTNLVEIKATGNCCDGGWSAGEKCADCGAITKQQTELVANGRHSDSAYLASGNYTCELCGMKRGSTQIDNNIIAMFEVGTAAEGSVEIPVEVEDTIDNADLVVFGFKDKYIGEILKSTSYQKMECKYQDVEIYVVYKANTDKTDGGETLCEIYVLSDSVMYFSNSNTGYQLFATYEVSEVRLENFDTSAKDADLYSIFGFCWIEKVVLGENFVAGTANADGTYDKNWIFQMIEDYRFVNGVKEYYWRKNYTIGSVVYPTNWNGPKAETTSGN